MTLHRASCLAVSTPVTEKPDATVATVAPDFFARLPTLLEGIPSGEPWHAVRFDTWGALS